MSDRKRILIVSSNVLFAEVLSQSLSGYPNLEWVKSIPSMAIEEITTSPPDVIIVDEAVGSDELGRILIATRQLACTQILLMNLQGNEFIVLNSHKEVIREAGDFLKTVLGTWTEAHQRADDRRWEGGEDPERR